MVLLSKMAKPDLHLIYATLVVCVCSSTQNGFLLSSLNVPQFVLERFMNQSNFVQTGKHFTQSAIVWTWSLTVVQRQIGQLVGNLLGPLICAWAGRKRVILFNTVPMVLGLGLQAIAQPTDVWELLLIGRFFHALACGIMVVSVPLFISEISPNHFRGRMLALHGLCMAFGTVLADMLGLPRILGSPGLWPTEYVLMATLQFVQLVALPVCPETPKELYIQRHMTDKAVASLAFYHGKGHSYDNVFSEYDKEKKRGHVHGNAVLYLWRQKEFRMSILVAMAAMCCHVFSGISIVTAYTTEILVSLGLSEHTAGYCTFGLGITRLLAIFPALFLVDHRGRRPLLLSSCWGCLVCLIITMVCFFVYDQYLHSFWLGCFVVVTYFVYGVFISVGIQSVAIFLASELVPTQQRAMLQGFSSAVPIILGLVVTFTFYPMQKAVGGLAWLILVCPLLLFTLFLQKYMPETKGRTIGQILDEMNSERNILLSACCRRSLCRSAEDEDSQLQPLLNGDMKISPTSNGRNYESVRKSSV